MCATRLPRSFVSEDFYDETHGLLFAHMQDMHNAGKRIDITLLVDRLKKAGDFEKIGGASFLARVSQAVPNAAHAAYYANIVREKAVFRSVIDASTSILNRAYEESQDAKEFLNFAEQQMFAVMNRRTTSNVAKISDVLLKAMERIDQRLRGTLGTDAVETGFADLDQLTGGLHNSELIILAARPSMGKTAFAMNIAENVGDPTGRSHPVCEPGNVRHGIGRPIALLGRPNQWPSPAQRHACPRMNGGVWWRPPAK